MAARIYFVLGETQGSIDPYDFNLQQSLADIYAYVQQATGGGFEVALSHDGASVLPMDGTPIQYVFPQPGEYQIYVQLTQLLVVNVYLDQQQISQTSITEQMPIGDFISQLLNSIQEYSPIQNYQLYDMQGSLLGDQLVITAPFFSYTGGQHQQVILNLTKAQQQQAPQLDSSPVKKASSISSELDLLKQLVVLTNISLLIDPAGQFVVYKFHFPVMVQGYLKKSQGKNRNIQGVQFVEFPLNKNIKYADTDDYGFAIQWDDGTSSSIKVKQQQ